MASKNGRVPDKAAALRPQRRKRVNVYISEEAYDALRQLSGGGKNIGRWLESRILQEANRQQHGADIDIQAHAHRLKQLLDQAFPDSMPA